MVVRTFFPKGLTNNCSLNSIVGELSDREVAAKNYEQMLPESIDILLLSVGLDGHIASLIPGSIALQEKSRSVVPFVGTKPPQRRVTIPSRIIQSASPASLFAIGY